MENLKLKKIDTSVLLKIRDSLKEQDDSLFDQELGSSFQKVIPLFVEQEYPRLKNETSEISSNVSRRLKNIIKKYKPESGNVNLDKHFSEFLKRECELAIPNDVNKNNNLGLTKSEFNALKVKLLNGDETLMEKVYLSQFKICLAYLIKSTSCTYEEAYECTMDALVEIRKDLLANKIMYGNLASYFNLRAKYVFLKKKRSSKENIISLDEHIEISEDVQETFSDQDQKIEVVKEAISQLGDDCKKIIKQFYYQNMKLDEIAKEFNKSNVAIRKQISRCRNTMRTYLSKIMFDNDVNLNG